MKPPARAVRAGGGLRKSGRELNFPPLYFFFAADRDQPYDGEDDPTEGVEHVVFRQPGPDWVCRVRLVEVVVQPHEDRRHGDDE